MMSAQSQKKGKHGAAARDSATKRGLSHEAIKLLKTQDAAYLRTTGERLRREIEKVEQEVKLQEGIHEALGEKKDESESDSEEDDDDFDFDFGPKEKRGQKKARKLVFADDRREQRALKKRKLQEDHEEEDEDEEQQSFGDLQKKQQQKKSQKQLEAERQALVEARRVRKMKKRAAEARENKLKALRKQYADITAAERELDWQRGRMDNSVGGTNKDGIKWKIRERKK
jgi:U3 small nucleolar RNA-associated protein 11